MRGVQPQLILLKYLVSLFLTGIWGNLKMRIMRGKGIVHDHMHLFLHEFSYRHLHGKDGSIFATLIKDLQI